MALTNTTRSGSKHQSERHNLLLQSLLALIKEKSRFTACTAPDKTLAKALGVCVRTMPNLLRKLKEAEAIKVVTTPPVLSQKLGRYDQQRTIYLTDPNRTVEDGARMLATLIRATGRTVNSLTDPKLCGQLQCTRDELRRYRRHAVAQGWVTFEPLSTYVRVGEFEALAPPGLRWDGKKLSPIKTPKYLPLTPHSTPKERLKDAIIKKVSSFHPSANPCRLTNENLACEFDQSVPWIKKVLAELVNERRLFIEGNGKARCLFVKDMSAPDEQSLRRLIVAYGEERGLVPGPDDIDIEEVQSFCRMNRHAGLPPAEAARSAVSFAFDKLRAAADASSTEAFEAELKDQQDEILASLTAPSDVQLPRDDRDVLAELDAQIVRLYKEHYLAALRFPDRHEKHYTADGAKFAESIDESEKVAALRKLSPFGDATTEQVVEAARALLKAADINV